MSRSEQHAIATAHVFTRLERELPATWSLHAILATRLRGSKRASRHLERLPLRAPFAMEVITRWSHEPPACKCLARASR